MYIYKTPLSMLRYLCFSFDQSIAAELPPTKSPSIITAIEFQKIHNSCEDNKTFLISKKDHPFLTYTVSLEIKKDGFLLDIYTTVDGFHMVSSKFKQIIEDNDPGAHNFWKANILSNKDDSNIDGYYLFQVGRVYKTPNVNNEQTSSKALKSFINHALDTELKNESIDYPLIVPLGVQDSFILSADLLAELKKCNIFGLWETGTPSCKTIGDPTLVKL